MYICICGVAQRGKKKTLYLLELEFQAFVIHLTGMLGTKLWSSARAVCVLNL